RRDIIRSLEREANYPIAILQDLQGPKIRLGQVKDGKVMLATGATVRLVLDKAASDAGHLPLPHPEIFEAVMPGHNLLVDDGKVRLVVTGL
ncbi:pyruvate kinase, partial [Acinetobacter baumannii]